jgi:hypothetical protein
LSSICRASAQYLIKAEGFETYLDEERGDFTFIEAREL